MKLAHFRGEENDTVKLLQQYEVTDWIITYRIWKSARIVSSYKRRDVAVNYHFVVVVLDEKGDGARDDDEDAAVDCWRWGGVAQLSAATMNAVIVRLLALIGARAIDFILFVLVIGIPIYNFFLKYIDKSSRHVSHGHFTTWYSDDSWIAKSDGSVWFSFLCRSLVFTVNDLEQSTGGSSVRVWGTWWARSANKQSEAEPPAGSRGSQGVAESFLHLHNQRSWPICPKICFCITKNVVGRLGAWPLTPCQWSDFERTRKVTKLFLTNFHCYDCMIVWIL